VQGSHGGDYKDYKDTVIFRINKLSYLLARTYLNFRLGLINFYADSSELLKIYHTPQ